MKTSSLAEARQIIICERSICHLQRSYFNHLIKPKSIQNPNFSFQNPFSYNLFSSISESFPVPQFPRGPINIRPRSVLPQWFPTNKQFFKNIVWKPTPHKFQNLPEPTSISYVVSQNQLTSKIQIQSSIYSEPIWNISCT